MTKYIQIGGLQVAPSLSDLIENEISPGIDIEPNVFWAALEECVNYLGPKNEALLRKRDELQDMIDNWHQEHGGQTHDHVNYKQFLEDIGYLVPEGDDFEISTAKTDPEISYIAGPQLVVPVTNARYSLNAANARWGSLYDALYGTDVISDINGAGITKEYNPKRGNKVIEHAMSFLDEVIPIGRASHDVVKGYWIQNEKLKMTLTDGKEAGLIHPDKFVGYQGSVDSPSVMLFRNNNLHIELKIDPKHPVGQYHPAGIKDVVLEAAVTTIQDFEDSVAIVDADDKVAAYRNWLYLMKGTLSASFTKHNKTVERSLNPDREFIAPNGRSFTLPGRSLLLVRNVGHLMTTDAVLDSSGHEIPEGILDGFVTSLCALHDLKRGSDLKNSKAGSIYIVKPKMHGPEEVLLSNELFDMIEDALGLERYTLKMGIMDEERRTSCNLKECIRAAKNRVAFINTGFLDRTGDEIHTDMRAGAMVPKAAMKNEKWFKGYEDYNVDIGLACGLQGKAQIGKGMWAMPDEMRAMLESKIEHPLAGANTAWVPSPTAAVLHAMHYHKVDVQERQNQMATRGPMAIDNMLVLPIIEQNALTPEDVQRELDNNTQGILGYVVRWIDQGIGCSKVPNNANVGLMEDRATLRISSQHIANWLSQNICSEEQVRDTLRRMAVEVDRQNADDPNYRPIAPNYENSIAFQTACDLIFKGCQQPNGYTEPILYARRKELKLKYAND
jgi:malate synthase